MLSYFCEERTTEFCKVINSSAENYRFLDIIIIIFLLSLLAYSCITLVKKLNELDIRNYSTSRLLKLAIGKVGWLYLIGITVCFIYAIFMYLATFYSKHVGYGFSTDPAVWGQAGDFFGGMLNPFLAFCSFMALLYTIKIQTEELRDTRREAKKSADALTGQLDILKVQKFYDIFYRLLSDFQSFSFKDKRRSHSDYSDLMRAYGRFHHKPDFNELMFIRNDICNLNGVSDSVGEICGDIFLFVENADVLEQDKIFCFRRLQLAMSEELSFLIGLYFNKIVVQKSHDGYVDKVISIIKKRKLINNGCFDNSPGGLFFALNTFSGGGVLLNQLGYDADDIGVTIVEWSDWVESDNCHQ